VIVLGRPPASGSATSGRPSAASEAEFCMSSQKSSQRPSGEYPSSHAGASALPCRAKIIRLAPVATSISQIS